MIQYYPSTNVLNYSIADEVQIIYYSEEWFCLTHFLFILYILICNYYFFFWKKYKEIKKRKDVVIWSETLINELYFEKSNDV